MPRDRYDDDRDDDDRPRRPRRRDDDDREDDDRPGRSRRRYDDDPPATPKGNGMATASLVLGILSVCFGPVTGVVGGILGLIGLGKPSGKGMAVAGLVLSAFFSLAWIGLAAWGIMTIPQTANKKQAENQGKILGIAAHAYHDAHAQFPAYVRRPGERDGQVPSDLDDRLGWRVNLLPFMEEDYLYRRFNLNEPWNSAANQPLSNTVVKYYADTDAPTDPTTRLRCFYDNGAAFDTRRSFRIPASFPDGTSNTVLFVEGGEKVTWTRFREYKFDPNGPLPTLGHPKRDVFLVVMGDSSVKWVRKSINPATLKSAIDSRDGLVLGADW